MATERGRSGTAKVEHGRRGGNAQTDQGLHRQGTAEGEVHTLIQSGNGQFALLVVGPE